MTKKGYITEKEASSLSGVSTNTLLRFAESGYISTSSDSRGMRLFSKNEVFELFGKKINSKSEEQITKSEAIKKPEVEKTITRKIQTQKEETTHRTVSRATNTKNLSENKQAKRVQTKKENEVKKKANRAKFVESISASLIEPYRAEVSRLNNLVELQEKLLDQRDEEIKDLKKQRDWLQERINKLDENREKDQLLLISETQMITKLLSLQNTRKSPFQVALEWVGIKKPASTEINTIEMKK